MITFLFEAIPQIPKAWLLYLWNLYPPFLGAGIRITTIAKDLSSVEVRLRLHWWNRNYIGTMFGGGALYDV